MRHVPNLGNENLVPSAKQTIHQRHKSTGNLLSMASNGSLKTAAAKRNALADSSNTKSLFPVSATGAAVKKNINISMNTTAIAKAQENSDNQAKPKDGLSRPAQRPLSNLSKASSTAHSTSMAQIRPLSTESQGQRGSKQQSAFKRPSKSVVYSDAQAEKQRQVPEALNAGVSSKTSRDYALNAAVDPSLRQPRHYQSQPVLNATQGTLRNQTSMVKNTAVPKRNRATMPPTSEKPEWDTTLDRHLSLEKGSYAHARHADDDATEAPYLDAVEELPREDHYPVVTSIEEPLIPTASLPEPIPAKIHVKTEAKAVDFQPQLPLVLGDDHADLSDYDEDYYDDQGYTTAHSNRSRGDTTTGATTIIFPPKVTKKDASELEAAKQIVDSKRTPEEDAEEAWDVSMVAEYGDDIFNYMRGLEVGNLFLNTCQNYANLRIDDHASERTLHGHSDRDPMVHAIRLDGLGYPGPLPFRPASRDLVSHGQLY